MRLIEWRLFPSGGIELIYAGAQPSDRMLVGDAAGLVFEVQPLVEVFGRDLAPDLIGARDGGEAPWQAADGGGLVEPRLDQPLDTSGELIWRLQPTSGAPARFQAVDALGGREWPVTSGATYSLEVPAEPVGALDIEVSFVDEAGQIISPVEDLRAPSGIRGTPGPIDLVAPDGAVTASLSISVAGPTLVGSPVWRAAPQPGRTVPEVRLSRRGLQRLRAWSGEGEVVRARLPVPTVFTDGGEHLLQVSVRPASGTGPGFDLDEVLFAAAPDVDLLKKGIERASVVRLVGRLRQAARRYLPLQLVIDGRPGPVQVVKAAANGKFDARLPIPPERLDGRLHAIEARQAHSQALLFAANERTAAFHTRWPVLQHWSQPPLSPESSPAAARHLKALQAWAGRAAAGRPIPDVVALHDELLAGVRRRPAYPPLSFPRVERPDVTVVMPAHNKFEVTYAGLAALLFAPVEASFEVVLVDDGSSDETSRVEEIVGGLRIVRHAVGHGFVSACNDGAAEAQGRFVCFLNNDTEVTAGWLDALLQPFADDPRTGLTGAKLIYPDGRLQEAGGIVWGTGDPWNAGRGGDPDAPAWNYRRQVDYLSGAAILTRTEVWRDLGGFGEEWAPAYFEDTDFAMKVRASGRRVVYAPGAEVYHFEGQTSGVDKTQGAKLHQELNRPKFKAKWTELYSDHGQVVGERPDLEKDRGAASRALILAESLASDAQVASAAAALQAQGYKITLVPLDGAWRQSAGEWGRLGVETLFAPYLDFARLEELAPDLDLVVVSPGAEPGPLKTMLDGANPGLRWTELQTYGS